MTVSIGSYLKVADFSVSVSGPIFSDRKSQENSLHLWLFWFLAIGGGQAQSVGSSEYL